MLFNGTSKYIVPQHNTNRTVNVFLSKKTYLGNNKLEYSTYNLAIHIMYTFIRLYNNTTHSLEYDALFNAE